MLLVNEKYAGQTYVLGESKQVTADANGQIEIEDKDMVVFFMKQGWKQVGKAEKKAEPKAEAKVEPKVADEADEEAPEAKKKWSKSK